MKTILHYQAGPPLRTRLAAPVTDVEVLLLPVV
jgi:hypothetical protein